MPTNPAAAYLAAEAASIPPLKLVRMVNGGAILSLHQALDRLNAGDRGGYVRLVNKSQNLIAELHLALDFEQGKEIARQLDRLYDWLQRTLTEAALKGKGDHLQAAIKVLSSLQEGWEGIRDEREHPLSV